MTDKEKLDAIRAEIHRLVNVRGYDREMANDLFAFMDSLPNEPVSEELEEAARKIATRHSHITGDTYYANDAWFFKKGAQWQKEQMMAKAVDAHVNYAWSGLSFGGFDWSKTGLDIGDKCKLIIIKED